MVNENHKSAVEQKVDQTEPFDGQKMLPTVRFPRCESAQQCSAQRGHDEGGCCMQTSRAHKLVKNETHQKSHEKNHMPSRNYGQNDDEQNVYMRIYVKVDVEFSHYKYFQKEQKQEGDAVAE